MLLTLSSGVVALRSHHTYRLQREWLHKIPYKWVPEGMEAEVLKYVMKPHLHPLHDCIFHLMTFMSYYDGKYTYTIRSTSISIGSPAIVSNFGIIYLG